MAVAAATFQRSWKVTARAYPWTYFTSTVVTGGLTVALAYLAFHAIGGGRVEAGFAAKAGSADYVGYVAVGAIAYTFAVRLILWVAKALIGEEREGTLTALVVTPARRWPYLIGCAGFSALSTLVESAAVGAVALWLGVRFPSVDAVLMVLAGVVFAVAVFALSVLVGGVMLFAGEAHITQNTLFAALALLGGFSFPRDYLPAAVRWLGELVPVTQALDGVRAVLAGRTAFADLAGPLGTSLAISAVCLVLGAVLLPRAERRAIERAF
ncbi:ABC transporter permease [Saccharothrix isguenensis]